MGFIYDGSVATPHADCRPIGGQLLQLAKRDPLQWRLANQAIISIETTVRGWLDTCHVDRVMWHAQMGFCGMRFRFTYGRNKGLRFLVVWQMSAGLPDDPAVFVRRSAALAVGAAFDCPLTLDAIMQALLDTHGFLDRPCAVANGVAWAPPPPRLGKIAGPVTVVGLSRARPGGVGAVQADGQVRVVQGHAGAAPPLAMAAGLPPALALTATPILWRGRSTPSIGMRETGAMQIEGETWLTGAVPLRRGQPVRFTQMPLPSR